MYAESIKRWLKRKSRAEAAFDVVVASFLVVCCVAVIGLTWGFGYLIGTLLQLMIGSWSGHSYRSLFSAVFASLFLWLIFVAHFRRERELIGEFPDLQYIAGRDSFFPWAVRMSVYTAGEVFGKMMADIMLIGPRLVFFTCSLFGRAVRLWRLDYLRCAQILEALVRRGKRISFADLEQIVPDANRFHVFEQLRDIDGVVFLLSEPAGVSLVQDLRAELRGLPVSPLPPPPPSQPEFHPPIEPPPMELPTELGECFYLLGISGKASSEEIRDAYRRKIKECHPDRFMRLGKDWQKLAEDRSKQINRAYEMISANRV
ncbi:MAG: J domain-containing protein [Verrucomicrobia bacterium]|nr:J domain-containing protein [Verrucomicrobiota bacterium]